MRALLCIDYTNDFVASDGALTCGEPAQAIDSAITRTAESFFLNNDLIIMAVDMHQADDNYHPESRLFPPHNIAGTPGRELYGELGGFYQKHKNAPNVVWLDKTRYSAFAGTNLYLTLTSHNIDELHVMGVCTDICVLHTLVDAYNLGCKLFVHTQCVASFNEAGHDWALAHFQNVMGATLV